MNNKAQNNNVFLLVVLVFSTFVIFCSGFLNFDTDSQSITEDVPLFTSFSFGNILSATHYVWFDAVVVTPILIVLGIIVYDKIRGIN